MKAVISEVEFERPRVGLYFNILKRVAFVCTHCSFSVETQ